MLGGEILRSEIQESGAAEGAADVVLEVLDFIEVSAPVHRPVPHAAASAQVGGAAQALAASGEIPDAAIVPAIDVAGGAGNVAVRTHAGIGGVVEDALALQHVRRQQLGGDGAGGAYQR